MPATTAPTSAGLAADGARVILGSHCEGTVMTGSDQASPAQGPGWQRPAPGGLVAAAGGAITLTSLFLPWYTLRLAATNFASVSIFTQIHMHGGDRYFSCDPIKPVCRESLNHAVQVAGTRGFRKL